MIMDLNTCPSLFSIVPSNSDDQNQEHHPFGPNNQVSSSSSYSSCSFFRPIQDKNGCFQQLTPLQNDHKDHKCADDGGSSAAHEATWNKEDRGAPPEIEWKKDGNPVKWMSSKMSLLQKMKKNHDGLGLKPTSNGTRKKCSYLGTYLSNNNLSYDNAPIRVCEDCNTTKTPLWRSGPKGPKSLCNACGIKQRKARRATMVTPAANVAADQKRSKTEKSEANIAAGSITNGQKKLGFEELLINLGKNLTFHRVFPEDEKDAAILLMALSSGLLHG